MSYSQWMAVFPYVFEHLGTVRGKSRIWDTKAACNQRILFFLHQRILTCTPCQTNLPKGVFTTNCCISKQRDGVQQKTKKKLMECKNAFCVNDPSVSAVKSISQPAEK